MPERTLTLQQRAREAEPKTCPACAPLLFAKGTMHLLRAAHREPHCDALSLSLAVSLFLSPAAAAALHFRMQAVKSLYLD